MSKKKEEIDRLEIEGYDEEFEWFDPKEEYGKNKSLSDEMEKHDFLALVLAGYKVMAPVFLVLISILVLVSLL